MPRWMTDRGATEMWQRLTPAAEHPAPRGPGGLAWPSPRGEARLEEESAASMRRQGVEE